jgi:hypothetical protein
MIADSSIPLMSEKGKEILAHAVNKEHCVIEFSEMDDGSMHIADITKHVERLEEQANGRPN